MITYMKTMDVRNLIKIEPLVVLYNDTDAEENGIEYSHDKPYNESENKGNMLLLQNVEKSQIKYLKDELSEIRKTVKKDSILRQISLETVKVIKSIGLIEEERDLEKER